MNDNDLLASPASDGAGTPAAQQPDTAESREALAADARRALWTTIIGLMVMPLGFALQYEFGRSDHYGMSVVIFLVLGVVAEIYASLVVVKVFPSRKSLTGRGRRRVRIAAVLNVSFYVILVAMFVTVLFPPRRSGDDLRRFDHPLGLVGTWEYKSPDGKDHIELILKSNGNLRYRQLAEPRVDFRGSWCMENWGFFFRMENLLEGEWQLGNQVAFQDFEGFTEDRFDLRTTEGRLRFVRKRE